MTAGQHIDYEALAQDAMRGVVRAVLGKVALSGLLGDHHFFIAFNTQAPGVSISKRLKEKYPHEMMIVLQHRFWDLEVNDERFEVKLTFDGIPERLVVPFRAVKVFYDPSVPYGLQFESSELMADAARRPQGARREAARRDHGEDAANGDGTPTRAPEAAKPPSPERAEKRPRPARRPRPAEVKPEVPADGEQNAAATITAAPVPIGSIQPMKPMLTEVASADDGSKPDSGGAKVVDFSKFRKK